LAIILPSFLSHFTVAIAPSSTISNDFFAARQAQEKLFSRL
jgi:hypothetical protein